MDLFRVCTFLFTLMLSRGSSSDTEKQSIDSGLEIYKKLFEVKRKDQMNALKNLIELNDVNQQYKIIDIMLKGLFKFFPSADTFQKALREEEKRRKKEEKRKEIRKGPRISRSQSEL
ncbi:coiled-coil domain-containing protein 134 isoform X2 [Emys orbicularis]|uniref:coiled-coil domain-containing protein 134 isoform X2 n=1 Tax=Emys orbicularis TaxID=82168 RepID=UPI0031FD77DE